MRYPGEVWLLPPDDDEHGDPKWRRHVLLTACDQGRDDPAVFAYASTQSTEAGRGAAYVLFDPASTRYGKSGHAGFTAATYIYPARLVSVDPGDLRQFRGRLIDEMAGLRLKLQEAMGLGAGTTLGPGAAAGSWRGRVIRLTPDYAARTGFDHGLVVTEPQYSNRQRYQIIVPLILDVEPEPGDVVVRDNAWLSDIEDGLAFAVLAVPFVHSVFHPTRVWGDVGAVVDEATMTEIDDALRALFAL
jgi:hypothetical protein